MAPRKGSANWRRKYPWELHPKEVAHFVHMQKRVAKGYCTCHWGRTTKGFFDFLKSVGKCPKNLKRPSLGRKDHSKGYHPGNCKWQEYQENSAEPSKRLSFRRQKSAMMKDRWSSREYRKKMSGKGKLEVAGRKRSKSGTFSKGKMK